MTDFADRASERVSTHSRLKAAGYQAGKAVREEKVSTHSRLKAAGVTISVSSCIYYGFNTQPPEGGWTGRLQAGYRHFLFQHTAA